MVLLRTIAPSYLLSGIASNHRFFNKSAAVSCFAGSYYRIPLTTLPLPPLPLCPSPVARCHPVLQRASASAFHSSVCRSKGQRAVLGFQCAKQYWSTWVSDRQLNHHPPS